MLSILFPGQGSQARGMGGLLFDEFPEMVKQADDILGYSIKSLCLDDADEHLNQTQYTQPALYTVNALTYLKLLKTSDQKPDFVAGHSLGEYNALLAAGVFDFQTGLQLVKKRGELMSQASPGSMAAIIGLKSDVIKQILQQHDLAGIAVANYNSYTQIIISGLVADIERAKSIFMEKPDANFISLKVSGAFHSPHMGVAEQEFSKFLQSFNFSVPKIPIISNVNAQPYHPAITKQNLARQITSSVQWVQTIEYLLSHKNMQLEEVGPGRVLTNLLQRIKMSQ